MGNSCNKKQIRRVESLESYVSKLESEMDHMRGLQVVVYNLQRELTEANTQSLRNTIPTVSERVEEYDTNKSEPKTVSDIDIENIYNELWKRIEKQIISMDSSAEDERNQLDKTGDNIEAVKDTSIVLSDELIAETADEKTAIEEEKELNSLKSEIEKNITTEKANMQLHEIIDQLIEIAVQQRLGNDASDEEQKKLERKRRDLEIAIRLARECSPILRRSEKVKLQQAMMEKQKYDLSKWKYSDLRDTINTSCDIELLEACRHEFHRRLKMYHAWKAKYQRINTMAESESAAKSIMEAATNSLRHQPKSEILNNNDRYFRIPFVRPGGVEERRGWWYAHFHGQYVVRQMKIHPDKSPVLLVADFDDMQMCELSLEESGLTRKRGVEILEHEFMAEWKKNGGGDYVTPNQRVLVTK